jgi:hypothetical protein
MTNNEIKDMNDLRPVLDALLQKKLIVPLTPAGRGQVVTHALYQPQELEHLQKKYEGFVPSDEANEEETSPAPASSARVDAHRSTPAPAPVRGSDEVAQLRRELAELRDEVSRLKREVEDLWSNVR